MKIWLPWQRNFRHAIARVRTTLHRFARVRNPDSTLRSDWPMTVEEAFAYDREMLIRDWEAVLGPREKWRKIDGL